MEFICKRCKEGYTAERWEGTIEIINAHGRMIDGIVCGDVIEAYVEGRGSTMTIIIGDYCNGHFLCVPDLDVGCPLADWDDLFWNFERLSRLLNPVDAITIVAGVATLMGEKGCECERIFYC